MLQWNLIWNSLDHWLQNTDQEELKKFRIAILTDSDSVDQEWDSEVCVLTNLSGYFWYNQAW
jgi:hypothetical protein